LNKKVNLRIILPYRASALNEIVSLSQVLSNKIFYRITLFYSLWIKPNLVKRSSPGLLPSTCCLPAFFAGFFLPAI